MCTIIGKPRGLALPSDEIIRKAFKASDDGFGLAFHHEGESLVTIKKGAMDVVHALYMIHSIENPEQANILLHFRQATQGKVCPANCHPYPLSRKSKHLRATFLRCPVAIAHNGIILIDEDGAERYGVGIKTSLMAQRLSDTQLFIRHYLSGLGTALFNQQVAKLIGAYAGGRFVFLSPQQFLTIGKFEKEDGLFYSSLGFKTSYAQRSYSTHIYDACDLCGEYGEVRMLLPDQWMCRFCFHTLGFALDNFDIQDVKPAILIQPRLAGDTCGFGIHTQGV